MKHNIFKINIQPATAKYFKVKECERSTQNFFLNLTNAL